MASGNQQLGFAIRAVNEASKAMKDIQGDLGVVEKKAKDADKASGGLRKSLGDVSKIAGGFILAQGLMKLPGLIGGSLNAASDLGESLSKMQTVFGSSAGVIEKWSQTTATSMGISKQAALEITGTYGNLFTAMGMGQKPAADMSMSLVQLAGDLASFNNLDPTEVLDKLRAGLVGEAEPLRALGVNMNAAVVEAKALEMGLPKLAGKFTDASLITARYAIIMDQTKTAQGDFSRTAEGAANRTRILNAQMADLSAEIGTKLLPAKIALLDLMANKLLPVLSTGIGYFGQMYDRVVALAGAGWDRVSGPLATIAGLAWGAFKDAWEVAGPLLKDAAALTWGALTDLAGVAWTAMKDAWEVIQPLLEKAAAYTWGALTDLAGAAWGAMKDGLALAVEQLNKIPAGKIRDEARDTSNWADAWAAVREKMQPAVDFLRPFVEHLLKALKEQLDSVKASLGPLVQSFRDLGAALVPLSPLLEPLGKLIGAVLVVVVAALILQIELLALVLGALVTTTIKVVTIAVETLTETIRGITKAFEFVTGKVKEWGPEIGQAFGVVWKVVAANVDLIVEKVGDITEGFKGIAGAIKGAFAAAIGEIVGLINGAIDAYNKIPLAPNIGHVGGSGTAGAAGGGGAPGIDPWMRNVSNLAAGGGGGGGGDELTVGPAYGISGLGGLPSNPPRVVPASESAGGLTVVIQGSVYGVDDLMYTIDRAAKQAGLAGLT